MLCQDQVLVPDLLLHPCSAPQCREGGEEPVSTQMEKPMTAHPSKDGAEVAEVSEPEREEGEIEEGRMSQACRSWLIGVYMWMNE